MSRRKIIFRNWILDTFGRDPKADHNGSDEVSMDHVALGRLCEELHILESETDEDAARREVIAEMVRDAIGRLNDEEQELVRGYHFRGQRYRQMSEETGRSIHKLAACHEQALRKLKKHLAGFVRREYGIQSEARSTCPICRSPCRAEIDRLISERDGEESWRRIIRLLRSDYGIRIRSPQVLIGHEKYHV